jgi:PLP dependent protein
MEVRRGTVLLRIKVAKLLSFVDTIHSVDRLELAEEMNDQADGRVKVLLQVKVSGEAGKAGVHPAELPELTDGVPGMPGPDLVGLLTKAQKTDSVQESRPFFRELARLRPNLPETYSCPRIHHLSMGMSQDYRVAVQEGATMVRVGQAIFGPRGAPAQAAAPSGSGR